MIREEDRLLLEQAATASLDRIRRDGEKAPERLKKLFDYLEENIFDKRLDVNQMKRDCKMRNNSVSIFFGEVTGQPPHAYIVERRVDTAAALLRDSALRIRIITELTGFSGHPIFTRNFKTFYGMTPQAFRVGVKKIFAKAGCWTAGFPSVEELRTVITHGLESEEAKRLTSRIKWHNTLESPLPYATTSQEPQEPFLIREEKTKVEEAWEVLREKQWSDQLEIVRNCQTFSTPAFFHFLRKKSVPEGRDNRQLGVHMAELAVECLEVTERVIGENLFQLRAQGWAWTGNARRLAGDLAGAEAAFSIAEAYLEKLKEETLVHAEYYGLKSTLRLWQGRLDEASSLHDRALPIFRAAGTLRDIAASLIEGAYTYGRAGEDEKSIAYSEEALDLLSGHAEPYLEFAACFNLTNACVKVGAFEKAKELLPRARELRDAAHLGEVSLYFLQWVEARLIDSLGECGSAADRYQAARDGFLKLGQNIHAALVSLDFALYHWKQDSFAQVREITLGIIPLLEAIQFHEEAVAGLKLLKSAIEKDALTHTVLQEVREYLERIRMEPWA